LRTNHYWLYKQYWSICNVGRNQNPGETKRVALSHEVWVWPGIKPGTSEVTGARCSSNFSTMGWHCKHLY
jgi:hypothetical protein